MKLLGDYHTHTTYTHGKDSIEDNVKFAEKRQLKEVAICEHCFYHYAHGISEQDFYSIKSDIDRVNASNLYSTKCLMGIEANLIDYQGNIDIESDKISCLDVLIVGYHKIVKTKKIRTFFSLIINNLLHKFIPYSKKQIEKNTQMYLKLLEKYDVDIIAHMNYGAKVDTIKVAQKAIETNTFIELNGKRTFFSKEEIDKMVEMGVKFIINSDAHSKERVGEVNIGMNYLLKYNIPVENVVNIDKIPVFKNHKKK